MSGELEAAYRSISMAKVPELWARVSYPSLKPLPSYLEGLYARLAMLQVGCYANLICQWAASSSLSDCYILTSACMHRHDPCQQVAAYTSRESLQYDAL